LVQIILWLVYASFTDGYTKDCSCFDTLLYGALAGLAAESYRDAATLCGLAGAPRRAKLQSRRDAGLFSGPHAAWRAYAARALHGACLFGVYDDVLLPAFDALSFSLAAPGVPDPLRDALQLTEALYPRAWDR
jgi:hypothetical protein